MAENAGGPHCLASGVTTNHVLGVEVVLPDGTIVWLGGRTRETPGYDLRGVFVGSEGTLGIVTKIAVRLLRRPEATHTLLAIFDEIDQASEAVSAIIAHGIVPSALEMMDRGAIRAVEPALHVGYPMDAGAVLLIEVDVLREAVEEQAAAIREGCVAQGAREGREAGGWGRGHALGTTVAWDTEWLRACSMKEKRQTMPWMTWSPVSFFRPNSAFLPMICSKDRSGDSHARSASSW